MMRVKFLVAAMTLGLVACSTVPPAAERGAAARQLALAAGLLPQRMTAGALPLQGFLRAACPAGAPLEVYIEGDGYAWVTVDLPSDDPTPVNPVALQLAAADPACGVVYLGRPGQYLEEKGEPRYWLGARFAPEVVESYAAVIGALARERRAARIDVTGFSGGGAVAALVVARLAPRFPGVALRTVAGNLDTAAWARQQRLTPLTESLNPAGFAAVLGGVPQLHLVGTRDRQVPSAVLDAFLAKLPSQRCVQVLRVDATHRGPWEETWRRVVTEVPACAAGPSTFQEAKALSPAEKP